ncbi:MAG: hypothetical protein H0U52_06050 [Chloroflexi bacterium]|nr:hypothetical protein [Chloroflexota bacterium]
MTVNVAKPTRRRTPTTMAATALGLDNGSEPRASPHQTTVGRPEPLAVPVPARPAPAFTPGLSAGESMSIGEIDQTIFDCPTCSRPLALGARRCPGCATLLVNGVALSKASAFVAAGLVVGLVVGGVGGALFGLSQAAAAAPVASGLPSPGPVASSDPSVTVSAAPSPSIDPGPSTPAVPPFARASLVQTVGTNDRLTAAKAGLASALAATTFDASEVARILRSISADSIQGEHLATRLSGWTGSADIGGRLHDFYGTIHDTASDGLVASVRNTAAYQRAATAMVSLLAEIPNVDAAVRMAATTAGVPMPESASPPVP